MLTTATDSIENAGTDPRRISHSRRDWSASGPVLDEEEVDLALVFEDEVDDLPSMMRSEGPPAHWPVRIGRVLRLPIPRRQLQSIQHRGERRHGLVRERVNLL
jgi:hypothetical protein